MASRPTIAGLQKEIRILKTRIKHLENDLKVTRTENEEASHTYFDLYEHLEDMIETRTKQLKKTEEALLEKNIHLEKALSEAETANRTKSEFLANVSHELRTPLTSVLGFSDLLKKNVRGEKEIEYIDSINAAGKNLLLLINDIIELSRIDAGKIQLNSKPVTLKFLFNELYNFYEREARNKGLMFHLEIGNNYPDSVYIDEIRLRQILTNLLGNAIKFTNKGSIELRSSTVCESSSGFVDIMIEVADTGIGISSDKFDLIFDAFSQQDTKSTRAFAGTGLGLSICKHLVEMMNGKISVESEIAKGSLFKVVFKNVRLALSSENDIVIDNDKKVGLSLKNKKVLIVDDYDPNRFLIKKFLEIEGCNCIEASNGEEAIELVFSEKPDIVLMDLNMPKMNGYEAAKKIRLKEKKGNCVPIIALTASGNLDDLDKATEAGCNTYLLKPVDQNKLYDSIREALAGDDNENVFTDEKINGSAFSSIKEQRDFVKKLQSEYTLEFNAICDMMILDQIVKFSGKLKLDAEYYNCHELIAWSTKVTRFAKHFMIDELNSTLKKFPELVDDLKDNFKGATLNYHGN